MRVAAGSSPRWRRPSLPPRASSRRTSGISRTGSPYRSASVPRARRGRCRLQGGAVGELDTAHGRPAAGQGCPGRELSCYALNATALADIQWSSLLSAVCQANVTATMVTVREHYDEVLSPYYSRMFGDFETKVGEQQTLLERLGTRAVHGGTTA